MNSACEIMKDAIVLEFLPKLEAQADVSEAWYWEVWHILARNTISTLAIRQCAKNIKKNLENK